MHIVMIFSTKLPVVDGIAHHVLGLADRLRCRGHQVTLMTRGGRQRLRQSLHRGFTVIEVPFIPLYPFHVYLHGAFIRKPLVDLRPPPDIIHLHSPLVPPPPRLWPIVTTFHTPMVVDTAYVENIGLKTLAIKLMGRTTSYWIEKRLLAISQAVITVSHGVAKELTSYYGYPAVKLYPIVNTIDSRFYHPAIYPRPDSTAPRLLYVGRLAYRKGLLSIVDSAPAVVARYPQAEYFVVGDGPLATRLKKRVADYRLNSHFQFVGNIADPSQIRRHYHQADVVLVPSIYEGLPMTLLEAMSCGKAIIATTADYSHGILSDRVNALLVPPGSVGELAEATAILLGDPDLARRIGTAARRTIVDQFAQDDNTAEVERVYARAIANFRKARIVR